MSSHQVKVNIGKDGATEIKVVGYAGAKCTDITKAIEKALGKVVQDKKTDEFYKPEIQQQQRQDLN